jgi:hypothetical protein
MHAIHVTNPREANPDESEGYIWTSHGLKGPQAIKPPQNSMYIRNRPEDPPNSHQEKAHDEWGPMGVGRTNLVVPNGWLPLGVVWLVPESILKVLAVLPQAAQGLYIEKRGLISYPTHFPTPLALLFSKARR